MKPIITQTQTQTQTQILPHSVPACRIIDADSNLLIWRNYNFKLDPPFISDKQISYALISFSKDILASIQFKLNLKLLILFKIKFLNNQIKTISYLQIINIDEYNLLEQIFIEYWNLRTEDYHESEVTDIIFQYRFIENEDKKIETKILDIKRLNNIEDIKSSNLGSYKLPNTMDITKWGNYHFIDENKILIFKKSSVLEYYVEQFDNYQVVELKLNNKILLNYKEIMNDKSDLSTFTRKFKNQEYIFDNGELILTKKETKVSYLSSIKKSMYNSKKFITMDLETRIINQEMISYCVSLFDGNSYKSFYLSDFKGEKDMLRASILYLMKRKYNNYKVYLHNFSNFDVVFLMSIMTDISDNIKPIIRDGRFINLVLSFGKKYNLHFRDSLLLLPSSLRNLAINFKIENKGIFPYKFVNNENIALDYIGEIPEFEYFDDITIKEYNEYKLNNNNNKWNLKEQTIKYCELDCLILYKIIDKFSNDIFNLFRIDLLKYPTLSSLAFAIFRSNYLKQSKIPLITGKIYEFIKKSYTGGSVDVYKPKPVNKNNKIISYDVNSLYPYVMKEYPMPVGIPIYFEGDILKLDNKPFGIFEVEIETPSNLKIPLLQTRIKTKNGYRTIAPLGNWIGVYCSEELYNAGKYGYKYKILRGYLFEKGNIFNEYVDYLYNLKQQSDKGSPNYIISKLLLNSLYGRLGMRQDCDDHIILSNQKAKDFYSKVNIKDILDFKNGKELISFSKPISDDIDDDLKFKNKNISVVVSSMITASGRIYMSQFKNNKNYNLYYSDTDSMYLDEVLDQKFIGNDLGQMKLEHIFDDAVFLSPKMYGGLNNNYEYVKIKGLKNPIKFNELKSLLKKDTNLQISQEKWYKDLANGKFKIKDEIYTLMVTSNKRKLLYDDNNIFYDTLPLTLKNGNLIE